MFGLSPICSYDNGLCNGGGIGDTWFPLGGSGGGVVTGDITNAQPTSTVATRDSTKTAERTAISNGTCQDNATGQRFTFNCFAAPCNCPPNSTAVNATVTNPPTPTPTPTPMSAPIATNNILDFVKTNPLPTAIVIGALIWVVSKK